VAPDEPKPVMVWLHGGGFINGSACQSHYNGANLARKGVVIVSLNYRIGALGFLVHEELYNLHGQTGNYALYDAIAALKWVQECIAAFGGDPDNVTIFGESAGGAIAALLQTAEIAEGLFHRAIAQSANGPTTWFVTGLSGSWAEAAAAGDALQIALGAADINAMREISADEIVQTAAETIHYYAPVMDGVFLTDDPRNEVNMPAHAPMMIGTNLDESTLFLAFAIDTKQEYEDWVENVVYRSPPTPAGAAADVLANYPAANDTEGFAMAAHVLNQAGFQETTRHTARGAAGSAPVYRYYYTHLSPDFWSSILGVYHGSEIAYIFGHLPEEEGYGPADIELSEQMMELWTSFARNGVPSASTVIEWPQYELGTEITFQINGPGDFTLVNGLDNEEGDYFEAIAPAIAPDYPSDASPANR
jgi:para-nitrobenzyl esterase